jgi:hypothetical protein
LWPSRSRRLSASGNTHDLQRPIFAKYGRDAWDDELVPGHGDDYQLDKDPLAYTTADSPSPYLTETEINMQRRILWRGLHRNRGWKRTTTIALTIMTVGFVVFGIVATVIGVLRAVF